MCWAGWLLSLVLIALIVPKVCRHFHVPLPALQGDRWEQIMDLKKATFSKPWRDERPLIIMAGDSHIEMGDWYGSFNGAFAVRNCGLSRAKIEDVTTLVSTIADRNPKAVVLICGVNNLCGADSVGTCITLYRQLLLAVESNFHAENTIVVSVMPLRASALRRNTRPLNLKILQFNQALCQLCREKHARYVDVNSVLLDPGRGLAAELTTDGLHLNHEGYARVAAFLFPILSQIQQQQSSHADH